MIWIGIDPGRHLGIARVEIGPKLVVIMCDTWTDLSGLIQLGRMHANLVPPVRVAVEGWEYQGPKKSRGVPHQAEAYGMVVGVLKAFGVPYVTVKRGQVLSSLSLKRNAKKAAVKARIRALTSGARPSNDHEADAVAIAIAGAGAGAAGR